MAKNVAKSAIVGDDDDDITSKEGEREERRIIHGTLAGDDLLPPYVSAQARSALLPWEGFFKGSQPSWGISADDSRSGGILGERERDVALANADANKRCSLVTLLYRVWQKKAPV